MPELFQPAKFSVRPEKGRAEPRLWVKRFCIWLEPGIPPVREIHLRQGLNIIWSPDPNERKGPIGHGAGKTTLCRLLRYCLGEDTFGSRDQRMRIHTAFPKGQVGIELMLDGEMWAVLRSINGRTRDIVLRDSTLEQAQEANVPTTMEPLISAVRRGLQTSGVRCRRSGPVRRSTHAAGAADESFCVACAKAIYRPQPSTVAGSLGRL